MMQKQIERKGAGSVPMVDKYPEVRGGVCARCGVLDSNLDSTVQYKLCGHYRGMDLMCSYCPVNVDPNEVIRRSVLHVMGSPTNPNELVVWCDTFECSDRHLKRFKINA